jgi:hypothetical protein
VRQYERPSTTTHAVYRVLFTRDSLTRTPTVLPFWAGGGDQNTRKPLRDRPTTKPATGDKVTAGSAAPATSAEAGLQPDTDADTCTVADCSGLRPVTDIVPADDKATVPALVVTCHNGAAS